MAHTMHSGPKKQRKVTHLLGWASHRKQTRHRHHPAQAALAAQSALDNSEETPSPAPRGSLYRSGRARAELQPGECGTVLRLLGSTQGRLRLLEMGLTPGTHIKVVRAAAFGGPLDILVRGYQLSLRRDEAASVWLGEEDET